MNSRALTASTRGYRECVFANLAFDQNVEEAVAIQRLSNA